ncbi:NAD-binding Rossmann fold oxidoreductase family protein [Melanomma pulvis-pyrius CBS 109.77]|uniref:NAD-binding Rossmann fold oxidoreductase family protein n=1 Tax=Melanomma pulvis-pyrius CBS 109.77 TaxID=1314802 RepID=A0A6A6XF19_9PLEO|nr:NAD-binding Rossmann fold oxidoreductase family protein [Melanomma pulvis-pyrius CBS 109.77]
MSQQTKRIGLIGLSAKGSWASRSHIHYLADTHYYKITALQNSTKASAKEAAEQFSLSDAATYGDPSDIAKDANVDIVAISVKVPGRYETVKPALEAGKDVFVEWPLARTLADAEEFVKLAKEKNVRTLVGLQARQSPSIIKAKELVESGKLGRILGTQMYGHGVGWGAMTPEFMLYAMDEDNGATLASIPFGHAVDALCYVLGEIESLNAVKKNLLPEISLVGNDGKEIKKVKKTAHDYISITGTLVRGGAVDVTYVGDFSRTGRNFYWEINGTEGSLVLTAPVGHIQTCEPTLEYINSDGKRETIEVEKSETTREQEYIHPGDLSFNVGRAWDAWAGDETAKGKGASVVTFEDALVRHRMLDAIFRSAEEGTRQRYL